MSVIPDWRSASQWEALTAPVTTGSLHRHPDVLAQVIQQFNVRHHARYQPVGKATWCNIFVWDVTRALGCEIPHWVNTKELSANAMLEWLAGHRGKAHGWSEIQDPSLAAARAQLGYPTVVAWANPNGPGHIAILIPERASVPMIAQAGGTCFDRGTVLDGFGPRPVRYFTHD